MFAIYVMLTLNVRNMRPPQWQLGPTSPTVAGASVVVGPGLAVVAVRVAPLVPVVIILVILLFLEEIPSSIYDELATISLMVVARFIFFHLQHRLHELQYVHMRRVLCKIIPPMGFLTTALWGGAMILLSCQVSKQFETWSS